ncbi:MAG: LacI family transcriptional regulator [Oscillospiraceae bacterium]|nr:LacI family transcriptional regulator [Oscillospiraceae bacterium]
MSNIKDVAKAAGVSTSTVSRVLNNNPLISFETREHVMKVIREHNYVPNSMARGLSTQKASAVALLVNIEDKDTDSFDNLFFHKIMYGIENVLYKNDLSLVISNLSNSRSSKERLNRMVQGKQIQGVIIPTLVLTPDLIKTLTAQKIPFVVIGEPEYTTVPFDWVDINNMQGGQQAVQHLIETDYKRIAFLGGEPGSLFNHKRLAGYRTMLTQHNMPVDEALIAECDGGKAGACAEMARLLELTPPPDAVICGNNIISLGAMKAIAEKGLTIPRDIGIISFDNYPIAELVEPTLTTIDINVYEMGVEAAKLILKLMANPSAHHQVSLISTSIQVRESTIK